MHLKITFSSNGQGIPFAQEVMQIMVDEGRTAQSFYNKLSKKEQALEVKQYSDN